METPDGQILTKDEERMILLLKVATVGFDCDQLQLMAQILDLPEDEVTKMHAPLVERDLLDPLKTKTYEGETIILRHLCSGGADCEIEPVMVFEEQDGILHRLVQAAARLSVSGRALLTVMAKKMVTTEAQIKAESKTEEMH